MGWGGAGFFKSLFKSLTKPRKVLKFGDKAKYLGLVCLPLDCNRLHWVHSLKFNLLSHWVYKHSMVFPPSPLQTKGGARAAMQNSQSVPKAPGSTGKPQVPKSEITHYIRERSSLCKQLCWLKTAACHCPSVVTRPTAPLLERIAEPSLGWLRQS